MRQLNKIHADAELRRKGLEVLLDKIAHLANEKEAELREPTEKKEE